MRNLNLVLVALVLAICGTVCVATEKPNEKAEAEKHKKSDKPTAAPGWIIVEEDVWIPLRYEPIRALDSARYHYRRNEEKLAAAELEKSASWLKLAAGHATTAAKDELKSTADSLTVLAKDLRAGKIAEAEIVDAALAKAAHALAKYHHFKAKDSLGKVETHLAAENLSMAAEYLQHAANSAHHQFGPDTQEVITRIYQDGKLTSESKDSTHDTLGKDLQSVEAAIKHLGDELEKISK